jgi:tetratricopeptide (TPR) repeat protein
MQDAVLTLRHREMALRDSSKRDWTLQYTAEAWHQLKDDSMYVATLETGFKEYPTSSYFFPRLMDIYTRKRKHDEALRVVDYALEADSLSELYLFAKSNVLLQQGQYAQSLAYSDRLLKLNDKMADAYFNGGTAYLNIALRMDPKKHKKQIKVMYQKALPYMERYRQLAPQDTEKWAPALYRIYFNLNMGKQFDEIDKILKK